MKVRVKTTDAVDLHIQVRCESVNRGYGLSLYMPCEQDTLEWLREQTPDVESLYAGSKCYRIGKFYVKDGEGRIQIKGTEHNREWGATILLTEHMTEILQECNNIS